MFSLDKILLKFIYRLINYFEDKFDLAIINKNLNINNHYLFYKNLEKVKNIVGKIPSDILYNSILEEKKNTFKKVKSLRQSILVSSTPKSGSQYLLTVLKENVNLKKKKISFSFKEEEIIMTKYLIELKLGNYIAKGHIFPNKTNIYLFKEFKFKILLLLRNPNEILNSMFFFLEKANNSSDIDSKRVLLSFYPPLVHNYFSLSFEKKIDFLIKNFLLNLIKYFEYWEAVLKDPYFKKNLLIINYDNLINNKKTTLTKILNFFEYNDIDVKKLNLEIRSNNYREKSKENNWHQTFNYSQKKEIKDLLKNSKYYLLNDKVNI